MTPAAAHRLLEPLRTVEPSPALLSMDTDVDAIRFQGKRLRADMREALVDAVLELTLDAAPSLQLDFRDPDSALLRSGFFGQGNLDGDGVQATVRNVRWRLMGVRRQADGALSCTFEDEAVAGFRAIRRTRVAPRGKLTRAQFIQARVREVRPLVKFVCPELNVRQPVGATKAGKAGAYGLPKSGLKVKEGRADATQRRNLETILDVGVAAGASRKELEAAVVACIVESVARTSATNGEHVGLFQMNDDKGTVAQRRNATFAAKWFFRTAKAKLKARPSLSVVQLAEAVEVSGNAQAYQRWLTQAKGIVTAYMGSGGAVKGNRRAAATGKYLFAIGPPGGPKRESYWDGFQRLATEVEWRFFVVAGVAYYMSEPRMYAAKPVASFDTDAEVVRSLEFDVDAGMRTSEATLTVDAELWSIPPGATVELKDCGPATGRWLVVAYRRSLFDTAATVSLRKPKPKLPEPSAESKGGSGGGDTVNSAGAKFDGKFRWPTDSHLVTSGYGPRGGRNHDGLDIGVGIGTPVKASASGKVSFVGVQSGYGNTVVVKHDATWSTLYAHLDSFDCKVGDVVRAGDTIAKSGNTGRSTGPHLHFEIQRSGGAIDPRSKLP